MALVVTTTNTTMTMMMMVVLISAQMTMSILVRMMRVHSFRNPSRQTPAASEITTNP